MPQSIYNTVSSGFLLINIRYKIATKIKIVNGSQWYKQREERDQLIDSRFTGTV
jgi:hypothetical protein